MAEQKKESKGEVFFEELAGGKFGGKAKYRLLIDSGQAGVEAKYFSVLRALTDREPFGRELIEDKGYILKTKDIYTSGETSSYWGAVEQRKGAQIDKFQQLKQNVGGMIKAMFQLLRDLRILEERLEFYEEANKGSSSAEVHLKSVWIDQVEGGMKNPTSVMGLTSEVGFAALADLFFTIHPKTDASIEKEVNKLKESHGINKKVREVLGRKLKQYIVWRKNTYKELMVGQRFKLGYLKQHYGVIRLYLNWLRPYLKNIKRLQMKTDGISKEADIIAAFETSKIELEFLGIRKQYEKDTPRGKVTKEFKGYFPVTRVRVNFVAMPDMSFNSDYQKGPIHRGQTEIFIEGAAMTQKQIDAYQKSLTEDDFDLLAVVDSSIEALKDDLTYYLEKAGGAFEIQKKEVKTEEKKRMDLKKGFLEPFVALGDFFKDISGVDLNFKSEKSGSSDKKMAEILAKVDSYLAYYIFKKQNRLITE